MLHNTVQMVVDGTLLCKLELCDNNAEVMYITMLCV